jgi:serine phosphatase RsbU (regulator of sigma subunit)
MLEQNMAIVAILSSMLALFLLYRKFNKRILFVNILVSLMVFSNINSTYTAAGGMYASDNAWLIVVWCWAFLVANKRSGFIWFGISLLGYVFLFYAAFKEVKDFRTDFLTLSIDYVFINYFFAAVFIGIILYLHEQGKEKYFNAVIAAKIEIEEKSKELELHKKDILSSIHYAKRIQYAVLPDEQLIYKTIPNAFIFYKPKDIVSGDFFWFQKIDIANYILVCADCTGHGVPGAFMTVIGNSLLNMIILENKITNPSQILIELDKRMIATLNSEKSTQDFVQDGMDLSLLKVNALTKEFVFTSAKHQAIFIRNTEIQQLIGSKNSIGGNIANKKFDEITISYQPKDKLYLFTDGYLDQFGGTQNKKFMIKRFRELLVEVHLLPMQEQKQEIEKNMRTWIGTHEQTDDITVIGIEF